VRSGLKRNGIKTPIATSREAPRNKSITGRQTNVIVPFERNSSWAHENRKLQTLWMLQASEFTVVFGRIVMACGKAARRTRPAAKNPKARALSRRPIQASALSFCNQLDQGFTAQLTGQAPTLQNPNFAEHLQASSVGKWFKPPAPFTKGRLLVLAQPAKRALVIGFQSKGNPVGYKCRRSRAQRSAFGNSINV